MLNKKIQADEEKVQFLTNLESDKKWILIIICN